MKLRSVRAWAASTTVLAAAAVALLSTGTASADVPANYVIEYNAHVQGIGWQGEVSDGAVAGTVGQSLRMEALTVNLNPAQLPGALVGKTDICVRNLSAQNGSFKATSFTTVVAKGIAAGAEDCSSLDRSWVGFPVTVTNTTSGPDVRLEVWEP